MFTKARTSAVVAEFIGTFVLALAVLTVSKSSLNLPFFVSVTAGLVVASMMLLFGRVSGAQLNPAITLGLLSLRKVTALRAGGYIIAQLIGGLLAYYLFAYFSGQRWHNASQFHAKFFVAEALGAILFSLAWSAIVIQRLESTKAAALVGFVLIVALVVMSSVGVVTLNPAVALGTRSWVWGSTVIGPIVGAIVGFQVYKLLFAPDLVQARESVAQKPLPRSNSLQTQRPKQVR